MSANLQNRLRDGVVIPAHPLALDDEGAVDLRAQRALTRYYLAAGVHGVAVGVHTTQFELHEDRGLLTEVWRLAATTADESGRAPVLVAGLTGDTADAVVEGQIAVEAGYEVALLCPWGMADVTEAAMVERARAVGEVLPTIGFYLQESVGGRRLGRDYWRRLFDLESVVAVKTAPFDRYRTNDVVQALLEHDRWDEVAVLTGNDDNIVHDLITPYRRQVCGQEREVRATGGLLGQWAVGARAAVDVVARVAQAMASGAVPTSILRSAAEFVDVNAAVFDVDHDFAGCVAGVNEVLRQQGLVPTVRCLGKRDILSPGQAEQIAQVRERYPNVLDEEFVATHRDDWLA
jgi:hypothetical protein